MLSLSCSCVSPSLSVLDLMDSGDPDICLCCCLSIRLSELLSVNVGLFDQYFRVVGPYFTPVFEEGTHTAAIPHKVISFSLSLPQVIQPITSCAVSAGTVMGQASSFRSWCRLSVCSSSFLLQSRRIRTSTLSSPIQTQVTLQGLRAPSSASVL